MFAIFSIVVLSEGSKITALLFVLTAVRLSDPMARVRLRILPRHTIPLHLLRFLSTPAWHPFAIRALLSSSRGIIWREPQILLKSLQNNKRPCYHGNEHYASFPCFLLSKIIFRRTFCDNIFVTRCDRIIPAYGGELLYENTVY